MNKFKIGDEVVVSGPLTLFGELGCVDLFEGETAEVVELEDPFEPLSVCVLGSLSCLTQWIDKTSLTAVTRISE